MAKRKKVNIIMVRPERPSKTKKISPEAIEAKLRALDILDKALIECILKNERLAKS